MRLDCTHSTPPIRTKKAITLKDRMRRVSAEKPPPRQIGQSRTHRPRLVALGFLLELRP
jgi:hypothetical protein